MKIETTAMDDVCFGMMTVALLYLVMKTVATLDRISKKVDAMVNHIGAEVESASSKLSSEANCIIKSLEKNAFGCKENLLQHVQNVELQCYRSKHGIAFGLGPRTQRKRSSSHNSTRLQQHHHHAAAALDHPANPATDKSPHCHHSTVALQRCIDRILKIKYKWPLCYTSKNQQQNHQALKLESPNLQQQQQSSVTSFGEHKQIAAAN